MGLQIVKPNTNFDFIGLRKVALAISAAILLLGLGSILVAGGLKYGIDFAGGMIVQVKFEERVEIADMKAALAGTELPDPVVQTLGLEADNEYLVRIGDSGIPSETVRGEVAKAFDQNFDVGYEVQRLEMVGPKVGADLRSKALEALFYAVLIIAIYISGRFEQKWFAAGIMAAGLALGVYLLKLTPLGTGWLILAAMVITLGLCFYLKLNYALGAVVAIIHDVLITVGIFSLLGKEFDLTIIAALLTIIGYSLNDTIIVFDRIRENLRGAKGQRFARIINRSVNQTLSRTVLTSGTTLAVVLALYFLGGGVIHDFALALLIGVTVGTYSSIFVASPILLGFGPSPDDLEEMEAEAPAKA
jgi:preprotein translocase subunit SecF